MKIEEHLRAEAWLNPNGGPRYLQLRNRIEGAVVDGTLPAGSAIPSEREIASITGLSRVTVRKAIQALVEEGIIEQRQGSGSFVKRAGQRLQQSLSQLTSFTEDMNHRGLVAASTWLERSISMPTAQERAALGLAEGDYVSRIARLRLADGQPMAIERASLSTSLVPNPMIVEESLYAFLDRAGNRPVKAVQTISAVNLNAEDAALLAVREGAAGLRIQRISYLPSGRVAEFTNSLYRGDAYDFVAELRH